MGPLSKRTLGIRCMRGTGLSSPVEARARARSASALFRIDPGGLFRNGPSGDVLCARHAVIDLSLLRSRTSLRIDQGFEVVSLVAHGKSLARAKTQAVHACSVYIISPRAGRGCRRFLLHLSVGPCW